MLSTQQLQVLRTHIDTSPDLSSHPNTADGAFAIAALMNATATPVFYVWRKSVSVNEIMSNGFDWLRVDNLSVSKARIWEWMTKIGDLSPTQSNVRAGILACFSAAGDSAMRLAIFGHCQAAATRAQKLFAVSGVGVTTTDQGIGPATTGVSDPITYQDVDAARNL